MHEFVRSIGMGSFVFGDFRIGDRGRFALIRLTGNGLRTVWVIFRDWRSFLEEESIAENDLSSARESPSPSPFRTIFAPDGSTLPRISKDNSIQLALLKWPTNFKSHYHRFFSSSFFGICCCCCCHCYRCRPSASFSHYPFLFPFIHFGEYFNLLSVQFAY